MPFSSEDVVPFSLQLYKDIEDLDPKLKKVLMDLMREVDLRLGSPVSREDFRELKDIVRSQTATTKDLAEAQERTEVRLEQLAEAQRRTEIRLEELAEAQKRTEARVEQLAEAQKKTEAELKKLVQEHPKTREQLGGLAHMVGYRLEDEAFKALPALLEQDLGVEVLGRLKRDFIETGKDRYLEVNIWGAARHDGVECVVIGEAKTQLKKGDVDAFIQKADQVGLWCRKNRCGFSSLTRRLPLCKSMCGRRESPSTFPMTSSVKVWCAPISFAA